MRVQVKTTGLLEKWAVSELCVSMTLGAFLLSYVFLKKKKNWTTSPSGGQMCKSVYQKNASDLSNWRICRYITVSQICSLICLPSIVIILAPNSTPIIKDMRESQCYHSKMYRTHKKLIFQRMWLEISHQTSVYSEQTLELILFIRSRGHSVKILQATDLIVKGQYCPASDYLLFVLVFMYKSFPNP